MEDKTRFEPKKRRLLERLIKNGYLRDKRLVKAFMEVPLERFIPSKYQDELKLYEDIPNLFYYQNPENYRTISAPHMISIMLQGLALDTKDDLLILGAKSGYIAALAHKLAPDGRILILEANSDIAKITNENLRELQAHENIEVFVKNPLLGMPDLRPWQKILVTGAITQDRIHPLLQQLDVNEGVLYAPIGGDYIQVYTQILRMDNDFFGKRQLQVRFTPLMTQVELDELELITDFDEIEIIDDPDKVDETLSKINIKYASSIFDEIDIRPITHTKPPKSKKGRELILYLKKIKKSISLLKKEDDVEKFFQLIDLIEQIFEDIQELPMEFELELDKIQSHLNQIRSFHIVRKELEKKELSGTDVIEKKVEIINKELAELNKLQEIIAAEINRLEK